MYIPEFWCGVIATVLSEIAALIVAAAAGRRKRK